MKSLFLILALAVPLMAQASSNDQQLNCLQWHFAAERKFVSRAQATNVANSILKSGAAFKFTADGETTSKDEFNFYFRYDRGLILGRPLVEAKYHEHIKNLFWHLHSHLGYHFGCSLEAPEPRPRISGSN